MSYTVAIVGLGNIGMLYDEQLPPDYFVLSHARSIQLHPDFQLVGAVDPDPVLRKRLAQSYDVTADSCVAHLLTRAAPDVVVVASPTSTHGAVIYEVLAHCRPLAILCEKPVANDRDTAQAIVDACSDRQVPLYINFIRRGDPGIREIKTWLDSGRIAMPFKAVVWYSKGLLHNGSHFADLLTFWFGPIRGAKKIDPGRSCGKGDAEPDIQFVFDHGSAIFCAAREENYSHYTVEVVAANGRLRYEQGGVIEWQAAGPHLTLVGYQQLQLESEIVGNDMNRYQYQVAEQLSRALRGAAHTLCTGACAVETQAWLEELINDRAQSDVQHG
jgi:predicted dehydrogenase